MKQRPPNQNKATKPHSNKVTSSQKHSQSVKSKTSRASISKSSNHSNEDQRNIEEGMSSMGLTEDRKHQSTAVPAAPLPQRTYYNQPTFYPADAYSQQSLMPPLQTYPVYPAPTGYSIPPPFSVAYPTYEPPYPYPSQYPYPRRNPSNFKLAVQQSLAESQLEEKLRKADEEALEKAIQLSLDEQDERLSSYDKADDEALQSALIRSVYDSGNRENGPVVVHQNFGSQDEELERKLAIERANENAATSGLIRSIYDLSSESNDSGIAIAMSSSNDNHAQLEDVSFHHAPSFRK